MCDEATMKRRGFSKVDMTPVDDILIRVRRLNESQLAEVLRHAQSLADDFRSGTDDFYDGSITLNVIDGHASVTFEKKPVDSRRTCPPGSPQPGARSEEKPGGAITDGPKGRKKS